MYVIFKCDLISNYIINPSTIQPTYSWSGSWESWSLSQHPLSCRNTPWTDRQSIAEPTHWHTFIPSMYSVYTISQTRMSLWLCEEETRVTVDIYGEHVNSTHKVSGWDSNLGLSCWVTVLATALSCCPLWHYYHQIKCISIDTFFIR